jgi:hypothetical protein
MPTRVMMMMMMMVMMTMVMIQFWLLAFCVFEAMSRSHMFAHFIVN